MTQEAMGERGMVEVGAEEPVPVPLLDWAAARAPKRRTAEAVNCMMNGGCCLAVGDASNAGWKSVSGAVKCAKYAIYSE